MLKTLDDPVLRKVTFMDLADQRIKELVVTMVLSALQDAPPVSEILNGLNSGRVEAYFVLTPLGQPAGLVAFTCIEAEFGRSMYVLTATVAPHVSETGWRRLFECGRQFAVERGCSSLQFDTCNTHMADIGRAVGAHEMPCPDADGAGFTRFTLEVSNG